MIYGSCALRSLSPNTGVPVTTLWGDSQLIGLKWLLDCVASVLVFSSLSIDGQVLQGTYRGFLPEG